MEFEKVKKKYPTDLPIPEKQGRVRGNKNIFKVNWPKKCHKNCGNRFTNKNSMPKNDLDLGLIVPREVTIFLGKINF